MSGDAPRLVLASASASRRAILADAHIGFTVVVSGVEERWAPDDDPVDTVSALAREKALSVAEQFEDAFVLGCDSLLGFGGELLGKPGTPEVAVARWRAMSGRSGVLHTGHVLVHRGVIAEEVVSTTVTFSALDPIEIVAYVASGEPIAVAGGFTLEGRSSAFIDRIDGDPGNVRGLSTAALRRLFGSFGIPISALWV